MNSSTAACFSAPSTFPALQSSLARPTNICTCKCNCNPPKTRRTFLKITLLSAVSLFLTAAPTSRPAAARDEPGVCKNCEGSGKVPCDLCSGTGFWRALSGVDPLQKYKGVVCPECEGVGVLTCPVCLGTGEGNVRGLLRRRRIEPGPGRILQSNY